MARIVFAGLAALLVAGGILMNQDGEAERLVAIVTNEQASSTDRVSAFGRLERLNRGRAESVAARLLDSDSPQIRLAGAASCARAGNLNCERTLIDMLNADAVPLGYQALAARALARAESQPGRLSILEVTSQEVARPSVPSREGFRWSLLDALGRYRNPADLDLELRLYRATGMRAPGRPVGLYGSPRSLPSLREAAASSRNASRTVEIQLAIARSGGADGVAFVRELLRHGCAIGALEGQIDMTTEDPLSGRLADHVLSDLGAHESDRQFFDDTLAFLRPTVCSFCGAAWAAMARMGTQGREQVIVRLIETSVPNRIDDALRVLSYNGAAEPVRALARRHNLEPMGEMYLRAHDEGRDREWYPLPSRGVY